MPLALATTAIVLGVLLWQLALPSLRMRLGLRLRLRLRRLREHAAREPAPLDCDPGRELRAEQRARRLLRSCVNPEDWAMYSELGFLRVWAALEDGAAPHAYLVYPHLPIVAYLPQTGRLLGEHCIAFPNVVADSQGPPSAPRLPDADDVLAKWLLLTASERQAIAGANMHLPGRQIPAARLRRDLARLARWEQERLARSSPHGAGRLSAS